MIIYNALLIILLLELICPAKSVFSFDYSQHIVDSFHLFIKLFNLILSMIELLAINLVFQ
jgi:hypothetical protein